MWLYMPSQQMLAYIRTETEPGYERRKKKLTAVLVFVVLPGTGSIQSVVVAIFQAPCGRFPSLLLFDIFEFALEPAFAESKAHLAPEFVAVTA